MSAKRIAIDSSVALKWRLRDEEATSQADTLLDDFLFGTLDLLTPTLCDYEIANALNVAMAKVLHLRVQNPVDFLLEVAL